MNPEDFKDFYTNESERYQSSRYEGLYGRLFSRLHHDILTDLLRGTGADKWVLEVACGTGHVSALLSDLHIRTISFDLTPAMIHQARLRTAKKALPPHFIQGNAFALPFPDNSFDKLVSTRFLHLFRHDTQKSLINEMHRVIKPGGEIIIDFDNWSSRWIFSVPYLFYNIFRYQRFYPFSIYNRVNNTQKMISEAGFDVNEVYGVGGTHLSLLAALDFDTALHIGRYHAKNPLRVLAEQFIVYARKK